VTVLSNGQLLVTSCSNSLPASDDGGSTWRALKASPWPAGFTWPALYEIRPGEIAAIMSSGSVRLRFGGVGE